VADLTSLRAALRYAAHGWKVFPLTGKHPIRGTHGFKDATTDRKQIKRWWQQYPSANVGIACDDEHGPIIIDADKPNTKKGEHPAHELLDDLALPDTRVAQTSPGKQHMYFDPPVVPTDIGRIIRVTQHGVKYAVDILGSGGYVVAPPSRHPDTGKRYTWTRKTRIRPLPESVLHLIADHRGTNASAPSSVIKLAAAQIPKLIQEGERDTILTSMAGTMRRRGMSEEEILAALRVANETRVIPPLPDKDLRRIAKSIASKAPAGTGENFTDLGNARRLIEQYGDGVRSISKKRWFIWEDSRWVPDDTGRVERMAKDVVRSLYVEAGTLGDTTAREALLKHAHKSEQSPRVSALIQLAGTEPEISIQSSILDRDPWKFNVLNGTIDLKTGVLLPHNRLDHITKVAPVVYDAEATCPKWLVFLKQIMGGDMELVEYLKRAVGYALTGDTREQCFFFMYGLGANGKSTFLEVIRALLGDYAQQAEFTTFLTRRGEGPRNDIARMRGVRFVSAVEAHGDRGFDEAVIQQLTGGDTITARELYERLFEFRPTHKIFLAANHKPVIRTQTEAMWRRLRLIPFTVIIPRDKRIGKLGDKLVGRELAGILNWALDGCAIWQQEGLMEPAAVRRATNSYRDENDVLGDFLGQRCVFDPANWISGGEFYRHFSDWWTETRGPRVQPISPAWFGRLLGERAEITQAKRKHTRGWRGIALKRQLGVE
jgi:putative DNA primase/helicase